MKDIWLMLLTCRRAWLTLLLLAPMAVSATLFVGGELDLQL